MEKGFTSKIQELLEDGMSWATISKFLTDCFKACPCSNVPVEVKFARQRNYNACARGRLPRHYSSASKHVLAELRRLHQQKRQASKAALGRMQYRGAKPLKQRKRKLSAWNMFVRNRRRRMRGGNFDMAGLANEWAEMSPIDKMQFEEDPRWANCVLMYMGQVYAPVN